jgi:hypothetical protein
LAEDAGDELAAICPVFLDEPPTSLAGFGSAEPLEREM